MNIVGGSFQWPPQREEDEQGPTATPMYIDPQNPPVGSLHSVGSLYSDAAGASVQQLLGLAEKIKPTTGPLAQSSPSPKPNQNGSPAPTYSVGSNQNGSPAPTYSVGLVTKFRILNNIMIGVYSATQLQSH